MPSKEFYTDTKAKAKKIASKVRKSGYRATIAHPYAVYQWGTKRNKKVR